MGLITLGYIPKKKEWIELEKYKEKEYNGYLVLRIDRMLLEKLRNIKKLQKNLFDAHILIDGKRRTGKSTLAKTIAYFFTPTLSIKNFISGLSDAQNVIEQVKDESAIIFDEGSLTFGSLDARKKANRQLLKLIDVIGVKRLVCIYCMPTFFDLNKAIAVSHSLFLLHVYTSNYFGTRKKRMLYAIGKKNYNSYLKPRSDFIGRFPDFQTKFEDEYMRLKKKSRAEVLGGEYIELSKEERRKFIKEALERIPNLDKKISNIQLGKLFGVSEGTIRNYLRECPQNLAIVARKI